MVHRKIAGTQDVSGHSAHFPRFMLQCTKSTGTRAGDGSKDHNLAHIFPYNLTEKTMPTTSDLREALAAYNKEVKKREQKHVQKIKQTTLIEVKKKDKLLKKQNKDLEGQPLTRKTRVVC
jgi:hypothetical protein